MSDRELLELAAKAAGLSIVGKVDRMIVQPDHKTGGFVIRNDQGGDSCWNPLTDDGDALRLLLGARKRIPGGSVVLSIADSIPGVVEYATMLYSYNTAERVAVKGTDAAATRRAITEWAAEIGKAMP